MVTSNSTKRYTSSYNSTMLPFASIVPCQYTFGKLRDTNLNTDAFLENYSGLVELCTDPLRRHFQTLK